MAILAPTVAAQPETPGAPPADLGPPPEVGSVIFEDPLTSTGVATAFDCPTGRGSHRFVDQGHRLSVRGKCTETATGAGVGFRLDGVSLPDGEIKLELKVDAGRDRAGFALAFRAPPGQQGGYVVTLIPALRGVTMSKVTSEGRSRVATRMTLPEMLAPGRWAILALRVRGPDFWLLADEDVILSGSDPTYDAGTASFALVRGGSPEDDEEVAVVVRNLRVSALAGSDQARAPSYTGRPVLGAAPPPGRLLVDDALMAPGVMQEGICPSGRNENRFVEEGLQLIVRGKCTDESTNATAGRRLSRLEFPDGEIRFDMRAGALPERAIVALFFREQIEPWGGYALYVLPGRRYVELRRVAAGERGVILAQRGDLGESLTPNSWHTFAVRAHGAGLWVLLDDQPILSARDERFSSGVAGIGLFRTGDLSDADETSVVVRNLRISALDGGPEERAPTYRPIPIPPSLPPASPPPEFGHSAPERLPG